MFFDDGKLDGDGGGGGGGRRNGIDVENTRDTTVVIGNGPR
jgi:hypothetical protein